MKRIDCLVKEKFNFSREYSKEIIKKGYVFVNEKVVIKCSELFSAEDLITVSELAYPKYVSRGGYKLEKAINMFNINLTCKVCLDIGASTGGFTDCMLQNNAKFIYAIDVGSNQLVYKLKDNKNVKSLESTDIRTISKENFDKKIHFICIDVSFISLTKIILYVKDLLSENGDIISLIKPQFESGKSALNKKGVVKDKKVHKNILKNILKFFYENGIYTENLTFSPIKGINGNIEYLVHLRLDDKKYIIDYEKVVDDAFNEI